MKTSGTRLIITLAGALCALVLHAQVDVQLRSTTYSDGVHPCFSVTFDDTELRIVDDYWRNVLKGISHRVSGRKELIGVAALVPAISPDTMRILVKTETSKSLPRVTVHVAFRTTQGYAGRDGDERMTESSRAFVAEKALAFQRENAHARLKDAEKRLKRLQQDLDLLVREHERATGQREKALQRAVSAAEDEVKLVQEAAALRTELERIKARQEADPSEEGERELKDMTRRINKAESGIKNAASQQGSSENRASDIARAIERNLQDQDKKRGEISKQEAEVERRTQAYEAIR